MPASVKKNDHSLAIRNGSNPFNSDGTSDQPLYINCCGYDLVDTTDKRVDIFRRKGRLDFQLIYIQEGKGDFIFGDHVTVLEKGTLILYKPGEIQHYSYYNSVRSIAYFIHFTGTKAEELLKNVGLYDITTCELGDTRVFVDFTMKLLRELQFQSQNYETMCAALLEELLVTISRKLNKKEVPANGQTKNFIPALDLMHNHYYQNQSIDEYAALCGMSTYYFIRKFKEYTGYSPHTYLIRIRMEEAKALLTGTNMNVSEVSFAVGYDNPLYFSRLFKKYTGQSPAAYKKSEYT